MLTNNIKWFRVPWTKSDVAHIYGMSVLSVGVRSIPVFGSIAFIDMDVIASALVVVGGVISVAIIAFMSAGYNIHIARDNEPLCIGLDAERIFLDRSLWRYGAKVSSFQRSDLRRLKIMHLPDHLAKKKKSWFHKIFRGYAIAPTSAISFDFQDRVRKFLFRHTGIHVKTEGIGELVNILAHEPGVTFLIEERSVAKEEWLAVFAEIQKIRLESSDDNMLKAEMMNAGF